LGFDGRNTENIELSLSEILPVYLVDRLYPSVAVPATNTAYLVGFRGDRKLITICGKFATVSHGIWKTGPRNLEKFAAENCGPYSLLRPLLTNDSTHINYLCVIIYLAGISMPTSLGLGT